MSDMGLKRLAWGMALFSIIIMVMSAILLYLAPASTRVNWLYSQVRSIVELGAPVVGLLIIHRWRRHRIGWLFCVYSILVSFQVWGHAIYYFGGSEAAGYSAREEFLLWFTEGANFSILVCQSLLLLWFPDGKLLSPRWRSLYPLLLLAIMLHSVNLFVEGPNWNGGETAGGILIDNPYGLLPESVFDNTPIGLIGFLLIIFLMLVAVLSLVRRYLTADETITRQLRWFLLGSIVYLALAFGPLFFLESPTPEYDDNTAIFVLGSMNVLPLYLAIGIAILRYRLYEIDLIIRRTVQYGLVTAILVLVYYGTIILLQAALGRAVADQAPLVIVVSTLLIAGLFNPLRRRVQAFIDRRFFRSSYDARQVAARFALAARDEVQLDELAATLTNSIRHTMQPESVTLWIRSLDQAQSGGNRSKGILADDQDQTQTS